MSRDFFFTAVKLAHGIVGKIQCRLFRTLRANHIISISQGCILVRGMARKRRVGVATLDPHKKSLPEKKKKRMLENNCTGYFENRDSRLA